MSMLLKLFITPLLLLVASSFLHGQKLLGEITDEVTTQVIPYAHIQVEGTLSGTVSNSEGKFELNTQNLPSDYSLLISILGYETQRLELKKGNTSISIQLSPHTFELTGLEVSYESAEAILDKFQENYSKNYYQESSLSTAFYRSTFNENDAFVYLFEAIVSIREFAKRKTRSFEAEIKEQRKSNDYREEKWSEAGNYLHQTIRGNPVLQCSDFLDPKTRDLYTIKRIKDSYYNEQLVYVISFVPKPGIKKPLYEAEVYIKSDDYALIRSDFRFDNAELQIKNISFNRRQIHTSFARGSVAYHKSGNWYLPKYISGDTGFEIISKESGDTLAKNVLYNEILFTNTELDQIEPLQNPVRSTGDVFKSTVAYDVDFWTQEVKVVPTELHQKCIADLSKHQNIEVQFFTNSATNALPDTFEKNTRGQLDSVLSVYHLSNLFNGVALVVSKDSVLLHKAYGYSDLENKRPLSTTTLFDIGSTTKQFTALLILQLMEEGMLNLEDSVSKFLPDYKHGKGISIHHLLAHNSGIPSFDYEGDDYDSSWFFQPIETMDFIHQFCSGDLVFTPGSRMEYSNSNYLLLTAIIEKIGGKNYYEMVQENLFTPLVMNHTFPPNALPSDAVASAYVFDNGLVPEPQWQKANMKGVGCIYSTSDDLLKWIKAQHKHQLIKPATGALLFTPHTYYEYYDADFGYSWAINKTTFSTDKECYFYGGTSLGFYSLLVYIPESEMSVILLNNTGYFPRLELGNTLIKLCE